MDSAAIYLRFFSIFSCDTCCSYLFLQSEQKCRCEIPLGDYFGIRIRRFHCLNYFLGNLLLAACVLFGILLPAKEEHMKLLRIISYLAQFAKSRPFLTLYSEQNLLSFWKCFSFLRSKSNSHVEINFSMSAKQHPLLTLTPKS